ncbi:MAG: hypothetical protein WAK50_07915 [Nitrososphaeraceae archaeon]|jgi:hypothetical protein
MSFALIPKSRLSQAELRLEELPREQKWKSFKCGHCKKWIFTNGTIPVEHRYVTELKPLPWVNVELNITIHNCEGGECSE